MKNIFIYKSLIIFFLAIFSIPQNSHASVKQILLKGAVKDTVGLDYKLSESEEDDILTEIEYYDRKSLSAILLYVLSIITLGITGIVATISSFKTLAAIRALQNRLKNYPEDDALKQKLNKLVTSNTIALGLGALYLAVFFSIIAVFAAVSSVGMAMNLGAAFLGIFAVILYFILESVVFKTNDFK